MRAMRAVVAELNSFWWAGRMLEDATGHRRSQTQAREWERTINAAIAQATASLS
jgi:hypothetical protein